MSTRERAITMPIKKIVKIKAVAEEKESLEYFLSQIDHLSYFPSNILKSDRGGYHVFVNMVVE